VGVIVARLQPRNPVGWILILFVVLFLIPVDAGYYAALRYRLGYHGLPLGPAGIVLTSLWPLAFALFPLVIGVTWLSFVGHQVLSWRQATGERRQQLKWLACGAIITLCVGLLGSALSSAVAAGPDRSRVRGPAEGRGGPGHGPGRPGGGGAARPGTRSPHALGQRRPVTA
jgi:hypothetical protein